METNAKNIIPVNATHPGSVLKCELQERGIKQKDFARAIGMAAPNLSELIKGKRHVTEAIAIKLEEAPRKGSSQNRSKGGSQDR